MIMAPSPIRGVDREVGGDLRFPAVAVVQQLLLVEIELLAAFRRELEVRALDDRVHGAGFLAQPAIDALRHVDVIARRPPAAVGARLGLDGDGLCGTDGLAELAGDAALLAVGVAAQRVLSPEARAQGALFVGIVDRHPRTEQVFEGQPHACKQLVEQQAPARARQNRHRPTLPGLAGTSRRDLTAATRRPRGRPRSPQPRAATAAGRPSSPGASAGRSDSAGTWRTPTGTGTAPARSWRQTRSVRGSS